MVPKQRKPGQTGGGGRMGHAGSRGLSSSRGGRPHGGGAGSGKKASCGVVALGMLGSLIAAVEGIRGVL